MEAEKKVPYEVDKLNTRFYKVVPVIVSFNTYGEICPLYVRIKDDAYKVIDYFVVPDHPYKVYKCTVDFDGLRLLADLVYHPKESAWTLKVFQGGK